MPRPESHELDQRLNVAFAAPSGWASRSNNTNMKYRKKPVVIEAYQLPPLNTPPTRELVDFLGASERPITSERDGTLAIQTLEGTMTAEPGDWIIRGVKGEYYPCKPDIFAATYEAVRE